MAVTIVKQPLVLEDMELGRGTTAQVRGGVEKVYKRVGGSTLPYDAVDGPSLKEKIDSLDAAGYTMSGLHDPSGGQEYPTAALVDGQSYTVAMPHATVSHTFAAGDLTGWVTKSGDLMVYNSGWTLIKISVASDDHLRIDGSNVMSGEIRMGDTHKITNLADGTLEQDAVTVKQVNLKVSISSIVNDLSAGGTSVPLSAEQGMLLDTRKVASDTTGIAGADKITNMMSLTQAEYDAITPNASTYYVLVG